MDGWMGLKQECRFRVGERREIDDYLASCSGLEDYTMYWSSGCGIEIHSCHHDAYISRTIPSRAKRKQKLKVDKKSREL